LYVKIPKPKTSCRNVFFSTLKTALKIEQMLEKIANILKTAENIAKSSNFQP